MPEKSRFIKRSVKKAFRKRWAISKEHILNPEDEKYFLKLLFLMCKPDPSSSLLYLTLDCGDTPTKILANLIRGEHMDVQVILDIGYDAETNSCFAKSRYNSRQATWLLGGIKKRAGLVKHINDAIGDNHGRFGHVVFFPEDNYKVGRRIMLGDGSIRKFYNAVNKEVTKFRRTVHQIEKQVPDLSED